jgi:effector-binding domain-containing protein
MTMQKLLTSFVVLGVCLFICSCGGVGIEKPQYTVQKKQDGFEIRRYEAQVIAETLVEADFKEAGNVAFGRLFKYISGENRAQQDIPMTAPVSQTQPSEKIPMTAPVSMQKTAEYYAVSFLLPSKYTLETAPEPLDERVVLKEIPAHTAAAIRYSGTWSQSRYEQKKNLLKDFIAAKELVPTGDPVFARYDPPFQFWFLRRNEVIIPVSEKD